MKKQFFFIGLLASVLSIPMTFANESNESSDSKEESLCETVEECESLIGTLEQQLSNFDQDIETKTQEQEQLKKTRKSKTKTVEELRVSVSKLKEEIASIQQEIEENEIRQQELEEKIQVIRKRINQQMIISQRDKHKNMLLTLISEADSFTDLIKSLRSFEHFSRQGMEDIAQLKVLVEELNQVIEALETNQNELLEKQSALEKEEALLVDEINQLIEIEKNLQIEIQQLQSYIVNAEEVKKIVEEQRRAIIKESDDYF